MKPTIEAGAIFHFTEEGQFQEEVIRYASNCIAWNSYQRVEDIMELEKLQELVSIGCRYADDPIYFYIFDTKVRILLKLGRKEEAFNIIYSCLKRDKNYADFNDIIQQADYISWKTSIEGGITTNLTTTETAVLKKAERLTTKIKQQIIDIAVHANAFEQQVPIKDIITIGEAKQQYKITNYHETHDSILVLKGDVFINGNIDSKWINSLVKGLSWKNSLYGVVIEGSLFVNGEILDDEYLELYVTGDVVCDYLFSGNGIIEIQGNADIRFGIYGEYNDGSLDIHGKINTAYLLSYDHSMPSQAERDFIYIEGGNGTDYESTAIGLPGRDDLEDARKLLKSSVWDEEGNFSADAFFAIVKKGENPFINAG